MAKKFMANLLYPKGKENLLLGNFDLSGANIKVALIDTGTYTYSAAHVDIGDISGVVGTAQTIANITVTDGIVDGDDVSYTAVTGNSVEAIVIYVDSGVEATSYLVAYIDTDVTGLPVTPNGGDIALTWDSGANKIFKL